MWGCRAASALAAVAVCGGGRVPGRDESLPYGLNYKKDMAVSCGPGMPDPYRMHNFLAVFSAGCTAFSTNMNEICPYPLD